ncbi:MAG: hypothetical protein C4348_01685 [Patescibacteria group bacterium]
MKKIILTIAFLFFVLSLLVFGFLNKEKISFNKEKNIAFSIYPFYYLGKEIIKDKIETVLILPPGSDPHNFDLEPSLAKKISGSSLIFYSGTDVDVWVNKIKNLNPQARFINLSEGLDLIKEKETIDPHFWLSLKENKKIAQRIYEEVVKIDPENAKFYKENLQNLENKINELENFAQNELKDLKSRYLITKHNAFRYFARDFNLKIIGYLEKEEGELTLGEIKKLIDNIKNLKIKVIFGEKFSNNQKVENFAKELGLKVYYLDTLEKGKKDFFESYKENIKIIKEALNESN